LASSERNRSGMEIGTGRKGAGGRWWKTGDYSALPRRRQASLEKWRLNPTRSRLTDYDRWTTFFHFPGRRQRKTSLTARTAARSREGAPADVAGGRGSLTRTSPAKGVAFASATARRRARRERRTAPAKAAADANRLSGRKRLHLHSLLPHAASPTQRNPSRRELNGRTTTPGRQEPGFRITRTNGFLEK